MRFRGLTANGGREHVERDGLAAAIRLARLALDSFAGALKIAVIAPRTIAAAEVVAAVRPLLWPVIGGSLFVRFHRLLVAFVFVELVIALAARVLLLEAGAAFTQDAEIMVRELQIVFGLDAITSKLGIPRHTLVFLEQLGRVAALTIVLPVARLAATEVLSPLSTLSTSAAPAATLTIVDQIPTSLRSGSGPFASDRQGCAQASAALTLSFRSQRLARSERPIVSGLGQERSSVNLERARPTATM
jgi:hypothetical protein